MKYEQFIDSLNLKIQEQGLIINQKNEEIINLRVKEKLNF